MMRIGEIPLTMAGLKQAVDDLLNDCCKNVQDMVGDPTGDFASQYWTGEEEEKFFALMAPYVFSQMLYMHGMESNESERLIKDLRDELNAKLKA